MHLLTIALLIFFVAGVSWYLTRICLTYALQRSLLDVPNERSSHSVPTPRGGGYSFVIVFLAATVILGFTRGLQPPETLGLLAGLAIAVVGGWDDYASLPVRVRLPIHLAAAAIAVLCFAELHHLRVLLGAPVLAFAAAVLVWLALVWLVNLTNFMDGIDGLAGTEAVTVASLCCVLSLAAHGVNAVALLYAMLAASAAGFLLWNWYPAKIFMGDVGSGFLGYCFGALILLAVDKKALSPFVPVILLGVFIVDATWTLAKRILRRERWYAPHKSHAFQHLAHRFGHERTTLLIAATNLFWLAPWAALAQWRPSAALWSLVAAWLPLLVAAQLLHAGEATSPWSSAEPSSSAGSPQSRLLRTATLTRTGASTLFRLYRLTEKHGFIAKHVALTLLNCGCVYLALLTRFDGRIPALWLMRLPEIALLWCAFQGVVLLLFRISRSHWRFTSAEEVPLLSGVAVLGSVVGGAAATMVSHLQGAASSLPRSIYPLDAFYSAAALTGVCLLSRNLFWQARHWNRDSERTRAMIYGADERGAGLLAELRRQCLHVRTVGFIDDRPAAKGLSLSGVPVLGGEAHLPRLAREHRTDLVIIPSGTLPQDREKALVQTCLDAKLDFRVVPSISENFAVRGARLTPEVVLEDLLGRKPVKLDVSGPAERIGGQVLMVTGAAGSIGAELCRQIARFKPLAIIGYEINETALFYTQRQMQELFPHVSFVPCIGSVQNRARLNEVLKIYRPSTVYHAAAYKHVPLMEDHLFEAVENNIFGTETLLRACEAHGVSSFVMISTDKAARPTSLMGTSKRVAEMLVRASSSPHLTCVSTRFGNVLGSNGSVIPIFREQIAKGGPVKVTHPAMVRFFMTIPEAAQLVLQASCLGSKNEIFVLDMGEPVKIVDLAERMIRLMGLTPGRDIEIQFTGMRPGEKLYEELSTFGEELIPTAHRGISVYRSRTSLSSRELYLELERLRAATDARSSMDALRILQRLVPDYTASSEIQAWSAPRLQHPQEVFNVG